MPSATARQLAANDALPTCSYPWLQNTPVEDAPFSTDIAEIEDSEQDNSFQDEVHEQETSSRHDVAAQEDSSHDISDQENHSHHSTSKQRIPSIDVTFAEKLSNS